MATYAPITGASSRALANSAKSRRPVLNLMPFEPSTPVGPMPPIALLRALPPGPLARDFAHLEKARRLAHLFAAFDRDDIEVGVDLLLAELDARDVGLTEDDADFRSIRDGLPGNPEDAEPDDDSRGDQSWPEWQTRGRHKLREMGAFAHEPVMRADGHGVAHEDDEDDDPAEADGDEQDSTCAEDEEGAQHYQSNDGRLPGCSISDAAEPSLAAPEACVGRWGGNLVMGETDDAEPWHVPVTLNGPIATNDRMPA